MMIYEDDEDDWPTRYTPVEACAPGWAAPDHIKVWYDGPEAALARAEIEHIVRSTLNRLPPTTVETIHLRFGFSGDDPKTLAEVGAILAQGRGRARPLSPERVRQIQNRAIRYMRWELVRRCSTTFERTVLGVDFL